jgi:hypothetical protein
MKQRCIYQKEEMAKLRDNERDKLQNADNEYLYRSS